MALVDARNDFQEELKRLRDYFSAMASSKPSQLSADDFSEKDECLLEGVLSRTWQGWSKFCRRCFFESCLGTTTASGEVVAGLNGATSEAVVSGASIRAKRRPRRPLDWQQENHLLRNEPTWGDIDNLSHLIQVLSPNNREQLLAGFSSVHQSAKDVQVIRNAAAHDNFQTREDVRLLMSRFIVFPISHPVHSLFWIHGATGSFLVSNVVEDLLDASEIVVG